MCAQGVLGLVALGLAALPLGASSRAAPFHDMLTVADASDTDVVGAHGKFSSAATVAATLGRSAHFTLRGSAGATTVSGVVLESARVGAEAFGKPLAIAAGVLLCVPVAIGLSMALKREAEPKEAASAPVEMEAPAGGRTYDRARARAEAHVALPKRELKVRPPEANDTPAASPSPAVSRQASRQELPSAQGTASPGSASLSSRAPSREESKPAATPAATPAPPAQAAEAPQAPSGPLCPGLVVRQPGGVTLAMMGTCAPYPQTEVVEIKKGDDSRVVLARAIISENAEDGGIILESSLRLPVAFLDTRNAISHEDVEPSGGRCVTVSRAPPPSAPGGAAAAGASPVLCTVRADGAGEGFVMRRGAGGPSDALLLAVRVHGDGCVANVVDAEGKLLASTERRSADGLGCRSLRLLHVATGVDSGLIIIAILAANKLR